MDYSYPPTHVPCRPIEPDIRLAGDGRVTFEFEGRDYETFIPYTWKLRGKDYRFVEIILSAERTIIAELSED